MRRKKLPRQPQRPLPGAASLSRSGHALCNQNIPDDARKGKKKNPKVVPSLRHPCAVRGKHFRGPTSWGGRVAKVPAPPSWYRLNTDYQMLSEKSTLKEISCRSAVGKRGRFVNVRSVVQVHPAAPSYRKNRRGVNLLRILFAASRLWPRRSRHLHSDRRRRQRL